MTDCGQDQPHSLSSGDSSFVLLCQGSMPPDFSLMSNGLTKSDSQNAGRNSYASSAIDAVGAQLTRSSISQQNSWGSEMNSHDVQARMEQLLKENYQLRETLNQNNLAMKTQFETLVMWQEEVFKTHQTHKQKFSETRDLVLKLRTENVNLKKQLEESLTTSGVMVSSSVTNSDLEQENSVLKRRLDDLQEKLVLQAKHDGFSSKKEQEMHALVESLLQKLEAAERNCRQLNITNENLVIQKNRTDEKYKKVDLEMGNLRQELSDVQSLNETFKQRISELEHPGNKIDSLLPSMPSLLPNSDARAQISNLFKQLEDERSTVAKLKMELEARKSPKPTAAVVDAPTQLTEYIEKLDDMTNSFNKQNERFKSMNSWLALAEENLVEKHLSGINLDAESKMKAEIATLKEHLANEQRNCQEKKGALCFMQVQFQKILGDYEALGKEWKKFDEGKPIVAYEQEIKSLNAELKTKNELMLRRDKELETLKQLLKDMQLQCEGVAILEAQVKVYQTDFNAERDSREKLVGEKEEISARLRRSERRTQELEKKLSSIQNSKICHKCKQPDSVQPEEEEEAQPLGQQEQEEDIPRKPFSCFQCNEGFRELQQLQEHVEECLKLTN